MLDRGQATRGRVSYEPFLFRQSNADPEHSVDGHRADAGQTSLIPIVLFLGVTLGLMLLYAQLAS